MPGLSTAPPEGDFKPDSSGVVLSPGIYARADRRLSRQILGNLRGRKPKQGQQGHQGRVNLGLGGFVLAVLEVLYVLAVFFSGAAGHQRAFELPAAQAPREPAATLPPGPAQ